MEILFLCCFTNEVEVIDLLGMSGSCSAFLNVYSHCASLSPLNVERIHLLSILFAIKYFLVVLGRIGNCWSATALSEYVKYSLSMYRAGVVT